MQLYDLGKVFPAAILAIALMAMALSCGGAAESPPAMADDAPTDGGFTEEQSSKRPGFGLDGADGAAGPAGRAGRAGPVGGSRSGRQDDFAAATPAPAAPQVAAAAPTSAPVAASQQKQPASADLKEAEVSDSPEPQSARRLIVESWITLEVTDIDATVRRVESLASQSGGWVESAEVFGDAGYRSATVRIRVPADRLTNGVESLRALGRVTDEGVSSTDVTDRLIDNKARLTAWYAQEERLVTLLENAPTVEDIIQIEQRIAQVRFDIEHVEASQRNLTNRVATSLITVHLRLPGRFAADPPAGNLNVSTGDPSAAADAVVSRVASLGGYVGGKRSYDEGRGRAVDLSVFVKPADLAPLMDYAATLGAPSGRQLTSVGPAPLNEVPNARLILAIRSNVDLEASLSLTASDPLSVAERIRSRAESLGGYVDTWNETRRNRDERVTMEMALVVKSSDLRDIMEYGAGLGDIEYWGYNAVGQSPAVDAPDARLQVSVSTRRTDVEMWIVISVIAVAIAIAVVAVIVVSRRRRSRASTIRAHDLEPTPTPEA